MVGIKEKNKIFNSFFAKQFSTSHNESTLWSIPSISARESPSNCDVSGKTYYNNLDHSKAHDDNLYKCD